MKEVPKAYVEQVAHIIGPGSAAAQALANAAERERAGQSVTFFKDGSTIVVKGIPATRSEVSHEN